MLHTTTSPTWTLARKLKSIWLLQVLESKTGDMQRQLLMAQSDLTAAKEESHVQEMARAQLEAQLAGLSCTG